MEFLADTWVLWLVVTVGALVGMVLYREGHRNITGTFSSAEDFSVRTIFLSLQKGEADLFVGYVVAMISFSLFVAGLLHFVRTALS